jgi:hypothetical protein
MSWSGLFPYTKNAIKLYLGTVPVISYETSIQVPTVQCTGTVPVLRYISILKGWGSSVIHYFLSDSLLLDSVPHGSGFRRDKLCGSGFETLLLAVFPSSANDME